MSESVVHGLLAKALKVLKLLLGLFALYHFVLLILGSFLAFFGLSKLQWQGWYLEFRPGLNVFWLVVVGVIFSFGKDRTKAGRNDGVLSKGPRAWWSLGKNVKHDAAEREVNE